jgi:hypothetical protein
MERCKIKERAQNIRKDIEKYSNRNDFNGNSSADGVTSADAYHNFLRG